MVIGTISIIGAILGLLGIIFRKNMIIGAGVLLFFVGFFVTTFTFPTLPWYIWGVALLLIVYTITKKK